MVGQRIKARAIRQGGLLLAGSESPWSRAVWWPCRARACGAP